jgi:hypothetical protein
LLLIAKGKVFSIALRASPSISPFHSYLFPELFFKKHCILATAAENNQTLRKFSGSFRFLSSCSYRKVSIFFFILNSDRKKQRVSASPFSDALDHPLTAFVESG